MKRQDLTTSGLINRLHQIAEIGIVNAKEDKEILFAAAGRLYDLRAALDPLWNRYLILDEGLYLGGFTEDGESWWTADKNQAKNFERQEEANAYLDDKFMLIGGGCVVLRGDSDAQGLSIFFKKV